MGDWKTGPRVETVTTQAPHNAVKAESLSIFAGPRCLLKNTELSIAEQAQNQTTEVKSSSGDLVSMKNSNCYGLVGPNGCGKSTLLKLIAEHQIPVPSTWDVFLVGQHLPEATNCSPVEEVLSADVKRAELLNLQNILEEEAMGLSEGDAKLFEQVNDRLMEVVMELSRWDEAAEDVTKILLALGFRSEDTRGCLCSEPNIETPMNRLSGGWRMKVELAKALWLKPKLLLLDEPTNHLDFQSLNWLESKLDEYSHTVVVVSHDVSFLHSTCREILWIQDQRIESMPRDLVTEDDLARMQRRKPPTFRFSVPDNDVPDNHGLSFHKVTFTHGDGIRDNRNWVPPLLKIPGEVRFSGTSRSVVLGRNGSGKSTFLDLCTGKLTPTRGTVDRTPGLKVAHYSQQTEELDRYPDDSAAAYLVRECRDALLSRCSMHSTHASRACVAEGRPAKSSSASAFEKRLLETARGILSQFGFEGDLAINVPVHRLSGGQKACLKFAVLSLQPAHMLLLDEPTNHLDAEACESLAKALADFKGGLVVVTHDETLIYRLIQCNWADGELLICEGGGLRREQNIGAHRLNTLKEQVRKAERAMRPISGPQRASRKQVGTKSSNGTPLCHAERTSKRDTSEYQVACPPQDLGLNTHSRNQLLAFRFTVAACSAEDRDVNLEAFATTGTCEEKPNADSECVVDQEEARGNTSVDQSMTSPDQDCTVTEARDVSEANMVPDDSDVVDDWEQLATFDVDGASESQNEQVCNQLQQRSETCVYGLPAESSGKECVPGDWEDLVSVSANTPTFSTSCAAPDFSDAVPFQHHPRKAIHESVDSTGDLFVATSSRVSEGSHSRLRKDLINLNKAVSKWIRKENAGEMSKDQVIETIKASKVVQQLRDLHGVEFQEDMFAQKLYEKRELLPQEKVVQAPIPVASALKRKSSGARRSRISRCG